MFDYISIMPGNTCESPQRYSKSMKEYPQLPSAPWEIYCCKMCLVELVVWVLFVPWEFVCSTWSPSGDQVSDLEIKTLNLNLNNVFEIIFFHVRFVHSSSLCFDPLAVEVNQSKLPNFYHTSEIQAECLYFSCYKYTCSIHLCTWDASKVARVPKTLSVTNTRLSPTSSGWGRSHFIIWQKDLTTPRILMLIHTYIMQIDFLKPHEHEFKSIWFMILWQGSSTP